MPATYDILNAVSSDVVKESFVEELQERAEERREPLLLSLTNKMGFDSPRFLVPHRVKYFQRTTLNTAISTSTNADTSITLDNLAVFPVDIRKNEILEIGTEFFQVKDEPVVSASTIVCQVRRGTGTQLSSTAATHSAGATVYIYGRINAEGSKFDRSSHITSTRREAYCQIFKGELEQTTTSAGLDGQTVGPDNNAASQIADAVERIYCEMQIGLFRMKKSGSSTVTNSNTNIPDARTCSGIKYWQDTYNGIVNAAGGAQITPDMLDSDIETIIKRGGGNNPATGRALGTGSDLLCVVNETQQTFINRFATSKHRMEQAETTLRNVVGEYVAQARVLFITAPEEVVRPDEYFLYDPKSVIMAPFTNGVIKEKDMAIDGDTEVKKMIRGEYGVAMWNPELTARRDGLATS